MNSPVVLLWRYNPNNKLDYFSPVNPKKPRFVHVDIKGFGLVMPAAAHYAFQLNCQSQVPEEALRYYEREWFGKASEWETTLRPDGFDAEVRASEMKDEKHHLMLWLYGLFGLNIFI